MKKQFPKADLIALGLPGAYSRDGDRLLVIRDEIVDVTRWSVVHELTFTMPGQVDGSAWVASYSVGATECQDESPWEYEDTVECTLVRHVEKVVKVWTEADA